jgi:hypothetical protein
MKKVLFIVLASLFLAAPVFADWSVTATWTRSAGPNLDYEELVHSGDVKCTVQESETTSCNFSLETLGGEVLVRSYNTQGAFVETAPVLISELPAPATGVMINVTYVSP